MYLAQPLTTVAAERVAARTRTPTSASVGGSGRAVVHGGVIRQPSATWGKDGRKIRMRC